MSIKHKVSFLILNENTPSQLEKLMSLKRFSDEVTLLIEDDILNKSQPLRGH